MHGLIVNQLRQFVVDGHGRDAWANVLGIAGVSVAERPPIDRIYPDADVFAIIAAASSLTNTPAQELLEAFGNFLAPTLLRVYAPLLNREWRTLDVVEHTEEHIHTAVRLRDPTAGPPYLTARRLAPDQVIVNYTSPRRLCAVAMGIVHGIATQFAEAVSVTQARCMLEGDLACEIVVRSHPGNTIA